MANSMPSAGYAVAIMIAMGSLPSFFRRSASCMSRRCSLAYQSDV